MLRRFGVVLVVLLVTLGMVGCGSEELQDNTRLTEAFMDGRTGVWVSGHGTVVRELGSDSSQQRFLLRIDEGFSLVVRHRPGQKGPVPIERGDIVEFHGRYEFHGGGGEMQFTYADPSQPGGGGWIRHKGVRYD